MQYLIPRVISPLVLNGRVPAEDNFFILNMGITYGETVVRIISEGELKCHSS